MLTAPGGYWLGFEHLVTGELSQVVESDLVALANFNYDDLGNRTSLTSRNGTSATWEHDAVSRLSSLTQNLAGSTNDLTIGSSLGPATALGDPILLEQLVRNLVDNAVRHNVPGGWSSITRTYASST